MKKLFWKKQSKLFLVRTCQNFQKFLEIFNKYEIQSID